LGASGIGLAEGVAANEADTSPIAKQKVAINFFIFALFKINTIPLRHCGFTPFYQFGLYNIGLYYSLFFARFLKTVFLICNIEMLTTLLRCKIMKLQVICQENHLE